MQIRRLGRAQVALRSDVHADRLGDLRPDVCRQERVCNFLVVRVDAVVGSVGRELMDEVTVVVQQRSRYELRRRAVLLGGVRGLQHVLGHRDGLPEVFLGAVLAEDAEDLVDQIAHRDSTARVLRSPSRSA